LRSKLDRARLHGPEGQRLATLYADLLRLRHELHGEVQVLGNELRRGLWVRRGATVMVYNLDRQAQTCTWPWPAGKWSLRAGTQGPPAVIESAGEVVLSLGGRAFAVYTRQG
jgi:hypothetical protein